MQTVSHGAGSGGGRKRAEFLPTTQKNRLKPEQWLDEKTYGEQPKAKAQDASNLANTLGLNYQYQQEKVYYNAIRDVASALPTKRPVVLDLDETVLDNAPYFAYYNLYDEALWERWVLAANAKAIPGALAFIEFLEVHNVPYYFITGRREPWRKATEANLQALGLVRYQGLVLKSEASPKGQSAIAFKQEARCKIEAKTGQSILLLIGDQHGDIKGQCRGDYQHLLPNLIYELP